MPLPVSHAVFLTTLSKMSPTQKALSAVLLFHDGTCWDGIKRELWHALTGTHSATTKTLCATVRRAIADELVAQRHMKGEVPDAQAPPH